MPIGTAASLVLVTTVLSTGLGILQGNKAAKAQNRATDEATALRAEIYEDIKARLGPTEAAGNNALAAMLFDMGLSGDKVNLTPDVRLPNVTRVNDQFAVGGKTFATRPEARAYLRDYRKKNAAGGGGGFGSDITKAVTGSDGLAISRVPGGFSMNGRIFSTREAAEAAADKRFAANGGKYYEGYEKTPGFEFRLKEGTDAIEAGAAARGGLYSGSTMKALNKYGQDYATNEYTNHLSRLFGITNLGTSAISGVNAAGQNFATGAAGDAISKGQNRADALLNVGDQVNSGLQNGLRAFGAFA